MFGSAILDVAVGLIFVYLIVSLMVTAVTELIASWRRWRAQTLFLGIQNLLDAPATQGWAVKLYAHPLIQSLSPLLTRAATQVDPKGGPSYIPSRTFALALLGTLKDEVRQEVESEVGKIADPAAAEARTAIEKLPLQGAAGTRIKGDLQQLLDKARTSGYTAADLGRLAGGLFDGLTDAQTLDLIESRLAGTHLGKALSALLAESGRDAEKLKENLEVWFNNSMDRVGGWYKRKTQWVHLLLAAALTVGINVDSIQVVQNLAHNSALRESLVAQAQTYAKQNLQPGSSAEASYTALRAKLSELDLPVGWWIAGPGVVAPADAATSYRFAPASGADLWATVRYHFWGWLLTAIAISLGAPFWFDMLNKVITIRSSGKAPEEKPKAPKEVPQPLEPGQSPPP